METPSYVVAANFWRELYAGCLLDSQHFAFKLATIIFNAWQTGVPMHVVSWRGVGEVQLFVRFTSSGPQGVD